MTVSILAGPSRWGQAPGRSAAHGRLLAGPVDPVRIPPLALDPYLVEQRYHRQHLRIFGVSNFVILDACLRPDQCWGVLAGLCGGLPGLANCDTGHKALCPVSVAPLEVGFSQDLRCSRSSAQNAPGRGQLCS